MNNNDTLHTRLKEYRELNGLSQLDVAKELGLSRQSISRWETGKAYPDLDNIILLCKLYNITSDELLGINTTNSLSHLSTITSSPKPSSSFSIFSTEFLSLAVILVLSAQFNFIGLVTPVLVFIWCQKRNFKHWLIYLLCVICFFISLNNLITFIDYIFFDLGNGYFTPV